MQGDWIPHPPERETFESQDGRYQLVISSVDTSGWKSRRSTAELRHKVGDSWQSRWRIDLPHAYRPRFAVVSSRGEVILFDEWINIVTRLSIVVLDPTGKVAATKDSDAVLAALDLPGRDVVPTAKYGWWLQAPPLVSQDGMYAEARAAGRTLRIRFSDGSMSPMWGKLFAYLSSSGGDTPFFGDFLHGTYAQAQDLIGDAWRQARPSGGLFVWEGDRFEENAVTLASGRSWPVSDARGRLLERRLSAS